MDISTEPHGAPASRAHHTTGWVPRWSTAWSAIRAGLGAVLGLVPHVMHHIGLLAGAAILTGVLGNSVLYIVGLGLSVPLLRRLQRRFGSWKAPAIGVAVFSALFALSAFVIGPALNPGSGAPASPSSPSAPSSPVSQDEHVGHHP